MVLGYDAVLKETHTAWTTPGTYPPEFDKGPVTYVALQKECTLTVTETVPVQALAA